MSEIYIKAYGKINLSLDVLRKRPDGYHDLEMVMQTVGIYDEVRIATTPNKGEIQVETDASVLPNDQSNLAYRAAKLLMDEFDIEEGVRINIKKVIPIAGGMAGGSADCAATLKGINELFSLGLDQESLKKRGVTLGADVPYCIMGGTAFAQGIGDKLTRLPSPPECHIVIAKPDIYVSTAYVYSHIRPDNIGQRPDTSGMLKALKDGNLGRIASLMYNVMEPVTVAEHPIITKIERTMLENDALNAIMSGSGPTVFGLFDDEEAAKETVELIKRENLSKEVYLTGFVNE